jgi:hypothetical protein
VDALNEVHALLLAMSEGDAAGAVRVEMGRRMRGLEETVRDGRIRTLELERQLAPSVAAPSAEPSRVSVAPAGLEAAFVAASWARFDAEREDVGHLEVAGAQLQASIKELQNQLASRRELFIKLSQLPEDDLVDRSKDEWLQSVYDGVSRCGDTISELCTDKARVAEAAAAGECRAGSSEKLTQLAELVASSSGDVQEAIDGARAAAPEQEAQIRRHFATLRGAVDGRELQMLAALHVQSGARVCALEQVQGDLQIVAADIRGAVATDAEGEAAGQLQAALERNATAHAEACAAVGTLAARPVRCWLEPGETQWLGDRLISYGHVGGEPRRPLYTAAAPHEDGWAGAMPGWCVEHFAIGGASISASTTHVALEAPGAVAMLLEVLRTAGGGADAAQNGARCLRVLTGSVDAETAERSRHLAVDCGAVPLLLTLLADHRALERVVTEGCGCLLHLASVAAARAELVGSHALLLELLRTHAESGEAARAVAACLRMLTPAVLEPLRYDRDGVPARCFQARSSGEEFSQREAVLLATAATAVEFLVSEAAVPLFTCCLRRFSAADPRACEHLLHLLGCCALVAADGGEQAQGNELCIAAPAALEVMQAWPADRAINETALCFLACCCSPSWGAAPGLQAGVSGMLCAAPAGTTTVLAAMRCYLDSMRVQGHACSLVAALLACQQTLALLEQLRELDVVSLVLGAMRCQPAAALIQETGSAALAMACKADARLLADAAKDGAVELVVDAMGRHPNSAEVQQQACELLAIVAAEPERAATVVRAGGCERALAALRNYANTSGLSASALRLLGRLLQAWPTTGVALPEALADAPLLVLGSILCHKANREVFVCASAALRRLLELAPENAAALAKSGGIQLLLECMALHHGDPGCAAHAADALTLFAADPMSYAAIVRDDGATHHFSLSFSLPSSPSPPPPPHIHNQPRDGASANQRMWVQAWRGCWRRWPPTPTSRSRARAAARYLPSHHKSPKLRITRASGYWSTACSRRCRPSPRRRSSTSAPCWS